MSEQRLAELHRRVNHDGFNAVDAFYTPNGDLILRLSHGGSNDRDVFVRVRADDDVELVGMLDDTDWEDAATRAGRINKGGNW